MSKCYANVSMSLSYNQSKLYMNHETIQQTILRRVLKTELPKHAWFDGYDRQDDIPFMV